jgi:hypothetical protein
MDRTQSFNTARGSRVPRIADVNDLQPRLAFSQEGISSTGCDVLWNSSGLQRGEPLRLREVVDIHNVQRVRRE